MTAKFNEIKGLIPTYPTQAQDECDNGANECVELKNALENIKSKLEDKFGADDLFLDFQAVIETI